MNTKINIAITDDEALIVQLLSNYFSNSKHVKVLLQATDGEELIQKLNSTNQIPDIVLLDLRMQEMDGIETAAVIKETYPEMKIIIISSHYKKSFIGYMIKNGIDAFLPKGISPQELEEVILTVYSKGHYFTQEHVEAMRNQISPKAPQPKFNEEVLSDRECEVLQGICRQQTAKEIAENLFITSRTVEGHKNNLLLKTGAKNSAGLVIYAVQNGIFNPNELVL